MMSNDIYLPKAKIEDFCRRWQITELLLFGSVLRSDFHTDSDIDILVVFAPNTPWDLLDLITMQQQLEAIFNRPVDLIEKQVIETSDNWIRRQEILSTAQVIYSDSHELAG
ncbi:nucleotidyltransferase [filamentous cyanobacterium CCP5]|nr:nucleotidyltransferase [filamentous cyanobacterium CCP5]